LQRGEGPVCLDGEAADLDVADAPGAVHDEGHALREIPGVVPDAVEAAHLPGRGDVAEESERQVELLRPGEVSLGRIRRDPDDLGVERGELGLVVPEPGEFALSAAGERLDEERDDDEIALGERLGQAKRAAVLIAERDLRRLVVDRKRLVAIGGQGRGGQQNGQQQPGEALQDVSTAWSTAPRKSRSGTAPSNWTRSLITTFGTPITW